MASSSTSLTSQSGGGQGGDAGKPGLPGQAGSGADDIDDALASAAGFVVWRRTIPEPTIERALRLLNLEIVRSGLTPGEIIRCARSTYFPHLRWQPDILALRAPVERMLLPRPDEQWADAQLLLRFPDEAEEWPLTPHVDETPQWAGDRPYRAIVGVPLSRSTSVDGCLVVWPGSHLGERETPTPVELEPGDIVVMHPQLQHTGTLNTGACIRYAVYFRLLAGAPG